MDLKGTLTTKLKPELNSWLEERECLYEVHNDRLTISGETESTNESADGNYTVHERSFGKFTPRGTKVSSSLC
jgi:hypothetical protein